MFDEHKTMDLSVLKYKPYSYSKMATHQQCPAKFKFKYIDKIPVEKLPHKHLDKGKFIHLLLEHNGDLTKVKQEREFKEILEHKILTKDDFKEYLQTYKKFINSKIGQAITSRKELVKELPVGLTPELEMTDYDAEDAILRGYIDAAYVDEKTDTLLLVDWKTGKVPEDTNFQQLMFYGISLFSKMPYDKIVIMYAYIEHNKVKKTVLSRADLPKYKKALNQLIEKIESDTVFEKNESALCQFCDFQNVCINK